MAWAHVQSAQNRQTGATSKAFTSNNAAGNAIVVAIMLEHSTDTISSVTDTRSNAYAIAGTLQGSAGNGYQCAIYYAKNITAGANTVTVTPTTGSTAVQIAIHEYSGLDTTAPLDQATSATGASTTPNSGSVTTTATDELIFGVIADNTSVTPDATLTTRQFNAFNFFFYSVDKNGVSAGSYAVNGTSASNRWVANIATFKQPGAGGGGGGPSPTYAQFLTSEYPAAAVLCEIQPAEDKLGLFTLDSGVVYKIAWPSVVQTTVVPGGLYRRLDFVREGGTTYTLRASVAAVQANPGSYYYDTATSLLYVATTTGSSPNTFAFIGAWFSIFLSTTTVSIDGMPVYLPLVSGLPTIDAEMPDPLFGATISTTGDLALSNVYGLFDQLAKRWIWRNKIVTFRLGSTSMAYSDFATVAVMRINGLTVDDEALVLQLEDMGSILNKTLPEDAFVPIATDGKTGMPKPLVFGTVVDCPLVFLGHDVGGNRDYWGAADFLLNSVTVSNVKAINRQSAIPVSLISGVHYNIEVSSGYLRIIDSTYFSTAGYDIYATLADANPATFGSCAKRLLNLAGELDANINTVAFTAADTAAPQLLGRYVNTPTPAADLMRELEQSCLGQVTRGTDGRWTCRVLDASLPASVALADADFAAWDAVEQFASVLWMVRVRYGFRPTGDWYTTSASASEVASANETADSHQVDTWLTSSTDAGVMASRLLFLRSTVPSTIAFEERGLTLMASSVGDLVAVTRSRAPVARTGRYDGQLLRILKLTKSLSTPSISGVLGDLDGHADQIARLADFSLAWSTATAEQRAVYGFLADSNGYIDSTDATTRNLKVVV